MRSGLKNYLSREETELSLLPAQSNKISY